MTDSFLPSMPSDGPTLQETLEVRDRCLCYRAQRTARAFARHFDNAFRDIGLTHGQFSLMMVLNQPDPPGVARLSEFLGMDRTSLTAKLKALTKRGLVSVTADETDRRSRRIALTPAGRALLKTALPIWRDAHDAIDRQPSPYSQADLRTALSIFWEHEGADK